MIVIMEAGATREQIDAVVARVRELGFTPHTIVGEVRTVVAAVGDERGKERIYSLESMPGVERLQEILKPFKLACIETHPQRTVVRVGAVEIGGPAPVVIAGPCSVEGREQILEVATVVKRAGAHLLRGGAFKPRTSPYTFQGLEEEGLRYLAEAREATGLPVVSELMDAHHLPVVEQYADMIQIGARNMQNFFLLKAVGKSKLPVLLKRGLAATVRELLMSAEYIMAQGNHNVVLCERGIRTFETETRNTLDLNAVPALKALSHLPVIVDPSHGTGHWQFVRPMAMAAIAAGADGLMIEVHPRPAEALSDGAQSLMEDKFHELMRSVDAVSRAVRSLALPW